MPLETVFLPAWISFLTGLALWAISAGKVPGCSFFFASSLSPKKSMLAHMAPRTKGTVSPIVSVKMTALARPVVAR